MNLREALKYYPPVVPSPGERAGFHEAVRLARALGVRLQPGDVVAYWYRRDAYEGRLGFTLLEGPPVPVFLATGLTGLAAIRAVAHELFHAREQLDGVDLLDPFGPHGEDPPSEARAQLFGDRAAALWLAQRRPRPSTSPQPVHSEAT